MRGENFHMSDFARFREGNNGWRDRGDLYHIFQRSHGGFTLVEVLIVMSLFLMIGSYLFSTVTSPPREKEAERVSQLLQRKLNWALQYADFHGNEVLFTLLILDHRVVIQERRPTEGLITINSFSYPPWLTIENNFPFNRITIHGDGGVEVGGQFVLKEGKRIFYRLYVEVSTGTVREEKIK